MSSILSTQNRHIFLRRKYCFLPPKALSPPVGRCDALMGLPPRPCSAIKFSSITPWSPARGSRPWVQSPRERVRAGLAQDGSPRAGPEPDDSAPHGLPAIPEQTPRAPWEAPARKAEEKDGGRRVYRDASCASRSSSTFRR